MKSPPRMPQEAKYPLPISKRRQPSIILSQQTIYPLVIQQFAIENG